MLKIISNSVLATEIAEYLGRELIGEDCVLYGVSTLTNLRSNSIIYLNSASLLDKAQLEKFDEVLLLTSVAIDDLEEYPQIICENPLSDYLKALNKFFTKEIPHRISAESTIEEGAQIGNNVLISKGCFIGSDVTIGDNTIVWENVVIKGHVKIGKNCNIKPNAVVGSDIFTFVKSDDLWEQFPQLGEIIIEDYVLIGANSTIEKGTLENTIIRQGAKVDDLVQIGSNCIVGKNSFIAAGTILSRNVNVGEDCWISPNVSVRDNVVIGDKSKIGIGAVVIHNVANGITVVGNPANLIH